LTGRIILSGLSYLQRPIWQTKTTLSGQRDDGRADIREELIGLMRATF
jgi:hypothetical protein